MKVIRQRAFILCIMLTSSLSHAGNLLELGEGVNLFAINGKSVSNGNGFFDTKTEFSLPDAPPIQILVSYTAEVEKGNDAELEESDLSVIKFKAENQKITIRAPEIESTKDLETFNNQLNWLLTTSDNSPINYSASRLQINGFRLDIDYEKQLEKFNHTNDKAAIISTDRQSVSVEGLEAGNADQTIILKKLEYWYDAASQQTRQEFKKAMKKLDNPTHR